MAQPGSIALQVKAMAQAMAEGALREGRVLYGMGGPFL